MKVALASSISIAGVLLAGGAAFALNSAVLEVPKESQQMTATSANESVTTAPIQPVAAATTPATTPKATSTTYRVGTAGSVVVQIVSGNLRFTSVLPAAGWTAQRAEYDDDGEAEVEFSSTTSRLEFSAWLQNGQIQTRVEVDNDSTPQEAVRFNDDHDDNDDDDHDDDREDDGHDKEEDD